MILRAESKQVSRITIASLLFVLLWMPAMTHAVTVWKFIAAQEYGFNVRGVYEQYNMLPSGAINGGGYPEIHVFPNNPFHVGNYNSIYGKYVIRGTEALANGTGAYDPINDPNVTNSFQLGPKVPLGFSPSQQATFFRTIRVIPGPEITLRNQGSLDVASGSGVYFTDTEIGTERTLTYQISNTGNQNLTDIAVTVLEASDFSVTQPLTTLAPGGTSSFTIKFRPGATGLRMAKLHIASNDSDENPFVLTLSGSGIGVITRRIEILDSSGLLLANGAGFQGFGSSLIHTTVSKSLAIRNTGNVPLNHIAVSVSGAGEFTVDTLPASTLAVGATMPLRIHFTPTVPWSRNAWISVASDDPANNPYTFQISGSGVASVTLGSWTDQAGLVGKNAEFDAIPFGDGVPNLLKYAFNLNAAGPDSRTLLAGGTAGLPLITTSQPGPSIVTRIEYIRRKHSDLTYTPKRSDTLLPGSFGQFAAIPMVTPINDEWERVVVQAAENRENRPAGFYIIEVTTQTPNP